MFKVSKSSSFFSKRYVTSLFHGIPKQIDQDFHISTIMKLPRAALNLPANVVDINSAEMGRFSPSRERDISGPVICYSFKKQEAFASSIYITMQPDPHVNKYDCRGAVSLSSSMQSNVPSPFSGNHTHLNMPGSQWGQNQKYLSDYLHGAHYLTLRNEYRNRKMEEAVGIRNMSSDAKPSLTAREKLKKAITEYGSTVIIFHVSISLISLGACYILISSGVDLVAMLKYFNLHEGTIMKAATSNAGTFVVAYAVHKVFSPLRIAMTLTATPFIVKYLRRVGFMKHKTVKENKST